MELTVSLATIGRLIGLARAIEAQDPATDDAVRTLLGGLPDGELAEVLALALIGRGSFDPGEWDEALEAGDDKEETEESIVDQLLDMPMLAGYLAAGLSAFDLSCDATGPID